MKKKGVCCSFPQVVPYRLLPILSSTRFKQTERTLHLLPGPRLPASPQWSDEEGCISEAHQLAPGGPAVAIATDSDTQDPRFSGEALRDPAHSPRCSHIFSSFRF